MAARASRAAVPAAPSGPARDTTNTATATSRQARYGLRSRTIARSNQASSPQAADPASSAVSTTAAMMLDGAGGIAVVGEAADGDQVPGAVDAHAPDVVLLDLRMPRPASRFSRRASPGG